MVFKIFLDRNQFKKSLKKQHISTKLDTGYRLLYELSYLVKKKFWSIFAQQFTLTIPDHSP
jgi:hypothetical protein